MSYIWNKGIEIHFKKRIMRLLLGIIFSSLIFSLSGQIADAPKVKEGEGPYNQLIIRGVTLINGNGAPPIGPVDIVVENNLIKQVSVVGYPGVPIPEKNRPV